MAENDVSVLSASEKAIAEGIMEKLLGAAGKQAAVEAESLEAEIMAADVPTTVEAKEDKAILNAIDKAIESLEPAELLGADVAAAEEMRVSGLRTWICRIRCGIRLGVCIRRAWPNPVRITMCVRTFVRCLRRC
jgi:hypothetical protein